MRALVTADWHADTVTCGVPRLPELERATEEMLECARKEADVFIFLGDLCNPDKGARTIAAMTMAAQFVSRLKIPSVWLVGNHDVVDSDCNLTTLGPLEAMADCVVVKELISFDCHGASLLCFPYVPLARRPPDWNEAVRHFAISEMAQHRHQEQAVVVLSHCTQIFGTIPGSELDMRRGPEQVLPAEIAERGIYTLSGHYHERTVTSSLAIPGAPLRHTFGEELHEPSYLLVDFDEIERVPS